MEYLFTYREEIQHKRILRKDCYTIMEYLADHLKELLEGREEHDQNECKKKLKSIPLHVNIGGGNISINHGQRMLVMSESFIFMPADGIEEWARASNTLLLTSTTKLTPLYRELGVTTNESIDVYTTTILPTFPFLPQKYHEKHLKFIRDNLLSRGYSGFSVKQNELIQVIQNVEFVLHVDGDVRKACNFYDPENSIFQAMCDESRFPQGYLKDKSWNEFLKLSGMQEKLTNDMVVEFANTIEMQGRNGLTEDLVSKSRGLVSHIFSIENVEMEGLLGTNRKYSICVSRNSCMVHSKKFMNSLVVAVLFVFKSLLSNQTLICVGQRAPSYLIGQIHSSAFGGQDINKYFNSFT